jgi:Lipoprotein LpqB beta-propeller domain/Sporulation and spore germination
MRNRLRLAGGVLLLSVTVTACANLPTSGTVDIKSLQGSGQQAQSGVQIVPVVPGRTWGPPDIVQGFLTASASFGDKFAVARKYLTPWFSRRWHPGVAATVIDVPNFNSESQPRGVVTRGPLTRLVNVTGQHITELQTAGPNQAGSIVAIPGSSTYSFSLIQRAGVWRIDAISVDNKPAKKSLLLLKSTDFQRDYQARELFFYPVGSSANALVPDPVLIPQRPGNSGVNILVNSLLHQPPAPGWLYEAAKTEFPKGTKLLSVDVVGELVVVRLGGAALKTGQGQRQRMADQLAATLTSSPDGAQDQSQIKSVVLKIGRQSLQRRPWDVTKLVPRALVAPLYFQVPGAPGQPADVVVRASVSARGSVPLPGGLGSEPFSAMAISTAPTASAVLAGCSGRWLYLMPQSRAGEAIKVRLPAVCTSLSWDIRGNLWVTANPSAYVIPGAADGPPARPVLVSVQIPPLPPRAVVQAVRVAPDGVRVAMIVRFGASMRILIAAISRTRNPSFTYLAQAQQQPQQMLRVGSDVMNPGSLTWLDPDHLLVLDRPASGKSQIYEVPLDGGPSTQVATPSGVVSLAASWPYGKVNPQLAVGITPADTSPGEIEIDENGLLNPRWLAQVKGITPVFPG